MDNAIRGPSRLLDALDSSMLEFNAPNTPNTPGTPTTPGESSGSNPVHERARLLARARMLQAQGMTDLPERNDADFLSQSVRPAGRTANSGGFGLNYDNETPVGAMDIGGPDQQEKIAEFVTSSINNLSHGLTVKSAMQELNLEDQRDTLPGLEVRLLPHQAIGVAWMLKQEHGIYRGGILADDMGLGKTVQMIATMAMNMPQLDDECRTTLIVVPAALLQQWKDEIDTKTNGILTVHVHHGKDKLKKLSQVKDYDVIVTTYQTLNGDFALPKDLDPTEEAQWLAGNGGILARTKFYRAIADEAQFIRNRSTRSSLCLAHVRSRYRWMLTGTPVTNTLADIYGLLRFGRFRPWNDWNDFNTHVAKVQNEDAPLAAKRAQAILAPILLRRTKNSTLEGKPILELPPKTIELVKLQFSAEERDVYNSFEQRTKIRLNKFIRERTLVKNHAAVLVMILRLRQLCCHPNLILSLAEGFDDPTMLMGSDGDKELTRAIKSKGHAWVNQVKKRFLARAKVTELLDFSDEADAGDSSCPVCGDMYVNDNGRVLDCGHEICFDCMMDLKNSPIAHDGVFGQGDETTNAAMEKKFEDAEQKGHRPCPTCKEMKDFTPAKVFKSCAFVPSDEELSKSAESKRRKARRANKGAARYAGSDSNSDDSMVDAPAKRKAKTFEELGMDDSDDDMPDIADIMRPAKRMKNEKGKGKQEDDVLDLTLDEASGHISLSSDGSDVEFLGGSISKPSSPQKKDNKGKRKANSNRNADGMEGLSEALLSTWRRGDDDMEPSTKMLKLMDLLKEWDASGDKTICYSQWTSMLDLIERLFSRHGIRSLRFDGRMDRAARDSTLATFKRGGGPKVILISTKCGGVGLNLVSANRIVNMDLSWNYAAESQAYDRAHRIGQEKDVTVKRLVVENTIEERMLKLQEVKVGLAEAALGEGTGTKLHKLSVKDIKFLFGMTPAAKPGGGHNNANGTRNDESDSDDD